MRGILPCSGWFDSGHRYKVHGTSRKPPTRLPGANDQPKKDTVMGILIFTGIMTKEATPAMNWPAEKVTQVVNGFYDWAISEGWERRTFQQINARPKRWFKDENQFAKTPAPASVYAAPANLKTA